MIKTYTRKGDIKLILQDCIAVYNPEGLKAFHRVFHERILIHKVKFPLLEFCAEVLYGILSPTDDDIALCELMVKEKTIGGNVIMGIILKERGHANPNLAFEKAAEYIADADDWYVSDIIGERVFGFTLLTQFDTAFPLFQKLGSHSSFWVVRSIGAGGHNAIKGGLEKENALQLFDLLISLTDTTNYQIRRGIGWAAKTTAKFHPDIIQERKVELNRPEIPNWFRRKIQIGLNRNAYAKRKRG